MKKRQGNGSKKIFNSINIILTALLFVELILVGNWVATGNPVRGIVSEAEPVNITTTTSNSLGTLVTKEGTVELMIVDNFENPELSKELYYLNENGKRYLLSTDTPLPVSAKIKVTGYLKDNALSFSNSPTKASVLQGTSYATTSTTIEPWPKTLGEQKYLLIILYNETDPVNFNITNQTKYVENIVDDYVREKSYGKASIKLDYAGPFILNQTFCSNSQDSSSCNVIWIRNYAIDVSDPFVNFNDYGGIIVIPSCSSPFTGSCPGFGGGWAVMGKESITTQDGNVNLYTIWTVGNSFISPRLFIHESAHNFGMHHELELTCGEFPNRKTLNNLCNLHGDFYHSFSGGTYGNDYSLQNKLITLGWINNENAPQTSEGTYFISSFQNDSTGTSKIHGLKIPIIWNPIQDVYINDSYGNLKPLSYNYSPLTHYYLEYWADNLPLPFLYTWKEYENETTYGLNASNITNGIFLRLGRNSMLTEDGNQYSFIETYLLSSHPNSRVCDNSGVCSDNFYPSGIFAYLLKNETYLDSFNKMSIKVLDMNESGALVKVSHCTDSDDGISIYTKGTLDDGLVDSCLSSTSLRERYCNVNYESVSSTYTCTNGCSNGACTRPTSTGCYIDPKTKKKVCPGQLT